MPTDLTSFYKCALFLSNGHHKLILIRLSMISRLRRRNFTARNLKTEKKTRVLSLSLSLSHSRSLLYTVARVDFSSSSSSSSHVVVFPPPSSSSSSSSNETHFLLFLSIFYRHLRKEEDILKKKKMFYENIAHAFEDHNRVIPSQAIGSQVRVSKRSSILRS